MGRGRFASPALNLRPREQKLSYPFASPILEKDSGLESPSSEYVQIGSHASIPISRFWITFVEVWNHEEEQLSRIFLGHKTNKSRGPSGLVPRRPHGYVKKVAEELVKKGRRVHLIDWQEFFTHQG